MLNAFSSPPGSKAEDSVRKAYAPIPKPTTPRHVKTYTERLKELRPTRRYASPIIPRQHVQDSGKSFVFRSNCHHATPDIPMSWIWSSPSFRDITVPGPLFAHLLPCQPKHSPVMDLGMPFMCGLYCTLPDSMS